MEDYVKVSLTDTNATFPLLTIVHVQLLVPAGFEPTHMSITPRITPLPTGLYEWLRLFVRNSFLRVFDEEEADRIMREVVENCRVDCQDATGNWAMTYMRLRFSAVLKSK